MLQEILTFQKIRNGDIRAFESLFRQYYLSLCRFACGFSDDMDVAEEIVQDLFYKLWRDRENLKIHLSVKSYLYGAVRNNSLQYLEHVQVKRAYQQSQLEKGEMDSRNDDPLNALEYKELENRLNVALQDLPERRRHIFCMNRFEGKTYAEIASLFSLSVKTVEAEMSKALKFLKKDLENYR